MKFSVLSTLALPFLASAAVHKVEVGQGGLKFTPNTVKAAVGDQVAFVFASGGHTVAQGNFNAGCQPYGTKPFYSGGLNPGQTWTITIKDTKPKAFYCSTPGHCESGMYGVINPSGAQTLAAYKKLAGKATSSKSPKKVQGGVIS